MNLPTRLTLSDFPTMARRPTYSIGFIRIFHRGGVVAEHHVAEALDYEWSEPHHREPLHRFLQTELTLRG